MRVGSLFSGYGGLDLALGMLPHPLVPSYVMALNTMPDLSGSIPVTEWVSDVEPGPKRVLEARFPDAPDLGDITVVDWAQVSPVDVIVGGSPCQDLSAAGLRAGMGEGTRSGLWSHMADAIAVRRPSIVIWENVKGALSAGAASDADMESDPGLLGVRPAGPVLRAAGRVLGDLASLGYDAQWTTLAASDVGAPHRRERLFVLAVRRDAPAYAHSILLAWAKPSRGRGQRPRDGGRLGPALTRTRLLPTPTVNDMGAGYAPDQWDAWADRMRLAHGNGNGHGRSLSVEARRPSSLGPYREAIARWEHGVGRPSPHPVDDRGRLSAQFVEWMMGLPEGWVTDVGGVSRTAALRMFGNGVVPQQAAYAISVLAGWAVTSR